MKKYLTIAVLLLVSVILLQTILVLNTANFISQESEYSAKVAVGGAFLCINRPLTLNVTCPTSFNQSTVLENWSQECSFGMSHPFGFEVNMGPDDVPQGISLEIVNNTDTIIIAANQSGVGNQALTFDLRDKSDCPIPQLYTLEFEILDINDPPHLKEEIESQEIPEGATLIAFTLNNHFGDVDNDPLTYTFTHNGNFVISINSNSSQVSIQNPTGNCESGVVYFTAKDPGNLTGDSNMVELKALCSEEEASVSPSSSGSTPQCTPKWQCKNWSNCLQNGSRYRQCYDLNACNLDNLEKVFWEECEYIEPQDPPTASEQQTEEETEEEIRIETPTPRIPEEQDPFMTYVLIGLFSSAVLTASYLVFRKQIRTLYAKIMWYLTKKQRKELLLSDADKKTLLKKLSQTEIKLNVDKKYLTNSDIVQELIVIYRTYFSLAFKLPLEFTKDEALLKIEKLIHNDLKQALQRSLKRTIILERHKLLLSQEYIRMIIQGLRSYVFTTSNVDKKDIDFKIVELTVKGSPAQKTIALIHNSYAALQFNEIDQAKKNYVKTLTEYENLSEKEKMSLQPEIFQLYYNISYVLSWSKKGKDL